MILPFDDLGTVDNTPEPGAPMSTVVAPYCEKLLSDPLLVIDATAIIFEELYPAG